MASTISCQKTLNSISKLNYSYDVEGKWRDDFMISEISSKYFIYIHTECIIN